MLNKINVNWLIIQDYDNMENTYNQLSSYDSIENSDSSFASRPAWARP